MQAIFNDIHVHSITHNLITKIEILDDNLKSLINFRLTLKNKILNIHPLEIFTIVLSAGMLGGIVWMLLAIPTYAVLKILIGNIIK